jgi:lipid II:glycine glycyltransferase (peptidoglycan interpeptide bridge formation enzyme)
MSNRSIKPLADAYDYKVGTANEQSWNQLVQEFDDGTIFQTWAYAAIEESPRNILPLVLTKHGEVVAIALVRFRKLPILGMGLAYVHRGPMWRRTGMEVNMEHFRQVLRALRNEFVCKRRINLRINPDIFNDDAPGLRAIIAEEGFLPTPHQTPVRTLLIDLTPSLDDLWKNIDRNWRRNLKRDQEKHFEVIEGSDDKLVEEVIAIYKEMASRKAIPETDLIKQMKALESMLPDGLKMKIMLCKSDEKICAGLVWSTIGDTGIDLIAATSNAGTQMGGSHLLRWMHLEEMKQQGLVHYDLNGINPAMNHGTYQFKKELAGRRGRDVFYLGKFDACAGLVSASLIHFRDILRARRLWSLQWLSAVLKQHANTLRRSTGYRDRTFHA